MSEWLDPVRAALDGRTTPVTLFIRDDDAGWGDEQLGRLLDVVENARVPIDVAAIPCAISPSLARALWRRVTASNGLISIHQHGFAHANHEATGRKCEFGPARSIEQQRADIASGRRRLEDVFEMPLANIFTPPWNRCTAATAAALVELRWHVLSCDVSAPLFALPELAELPVCLDWTGRKGICKGAVTWGRSIAHAIARAIEPVGLMLHHAVMAQDDRRFLAELLAVIVAHPMVHIRSMLQCSLEVARCAVAGET